MRKVLLALLLVPSRARRRRCPTYPHAQTRRTTSIRALDPVGAAPRRRRPRRAPRQPQPQKPNVIVVGPDGKVDYEPSAARGARRRLLLRPGDQPARAATQAPSRASTPDRRPSSTSCARGDTLWDICCYYFNDPWQWPKVWSYNPQITNPHWIYPGDLVRLLPRGMFARAAAGARARATAPDAASSRSTCPPPQRSARRRHQADRVRREVGPRQVDQVDGAVDEKELLGIGDSVYLSYPANNPPKVGQRYSIYKPDNSVKAGGKDSARTCTCSARVEVVSVKQDKRARGVIVEANQEIERGAKVGPLVKQFKNVAAGAAEGRRARLDRRDADARTS